MFFISATGPPVGYVMWHVANRTWPAKRGQIGSSGGLFATTATTTRWRTWKHRHFPRLSVPVPVPVSVSVCVNAKLSCCTSEHICICLGKIGKFGEIPGGRHPSATGSRQAVIPKTLNWPRQDIDFRFCPIFSQAPAPYLCMVSCCYHYIHTYIYLVGRIYKHLLFRSTLGGASVQMKIQFEMEIILFLQLFSHCCCLFVIPWQSFCFCSCFSGLS